MSDVEQLTHNNQERRRWEEEMARERMEEEHRRRAAEVERDCLNDIATDYAKLRNDKQDVLWAANTACAMFCGMCGTMLAIGLVETHLPTVIISALCGGVFLAAGTMIERRLKGWEK